MITDRCVFEMKNNNNMVGIMKKQLEDVTQQLWFKHYRPSSLVLFMFSLTKTKLGSVVHK